MVPFANSVQARTSEVSKNSFELHQKAATSAIDDAKIFGARVQYACSFIRPYTVEQNDSLGSLDVSVSGTNVMFLLITFYSPPSQRPLAQHPNKLQRILIGLLSHCLYAPEFAVGKVADLLACRILCVCRIKGRPKHPKKTRK